jgi:gluconolactonase
MTVDLATLIDPAAPLTQIGSGYEFTEGPVWDRWRSCLLFSDIPGDARWRWTRAEGVQLDLAPTFKGNGMAFDNDGHLLVCEQSVSCLVRFREGRRELVAHHYRGTYLNSPNDVVTRGSDGSIYFTDPDYGRWNDWIGQERTQNGVGYNALFRVPPGGGELELLVAEDEFDHPNGLCFSPDEKLLYVNDSGNLKVKVFDVADDGSLGPSRTIAEGVGSGAPGAGNCDGMECDEHGNVWTTGPGGVWVLTPEGERIGIIETPEVCGSLCWGEGAERNTLFLMTSTTAHMVETRVTSAPLPPF